MLRLSWRCGGLPGQIGELAPRHVEAYQLSRPPHPPRRQAHLETVLAQRDADQGVGAERLDHGGAGASMAAAVAGLGPLEVLRTDTGCHGHGPPPGQAQAAG